jgi:outer membrane protein assembly factor BamB/predicted phosphodiesterase
MTGVGTAMKLRTATTRRRSAAGFLLAAVLAILAFSPAGCSRGPLRFAWLSDMHVGSDRGADDLRAAVIDINGIKGLRFALVTGDITEMGSLEEFRQAKNILDGLRVPYHIIPGNHDTKWSESGGTDFSRLWGSDHFVFASGGFRFIGLAQGPVLKMGDGHWAPQDVRWLEKLLAEKHAMDRRVVFVTHYPLDDSIANWYVVLDKLKAVPTAVILVGHGHRHRAMEFEGIPGVMSRSILGTKETPPGYTVVEIGAKAMTFSEKAGGKSLPPWHTIGLEKSRTPMPAGRRETGEEEVKAGSPPRPDFSVNALYPNVRVRWHHDTGWTIASSAAVYGETVIVGDASGVVRALRVADGSVAWEFKAAGGPVYSTPDVGGGRVVFGSTDGSVWALNAATGSPVWSLHRASEHLSVSIVACPRIAGGVVFIGPSAGDFDALDLAKGDVVWSHHGTGGFVETKPLVAVGKVVFGAWDGRLYALDEKSGELAWTWQGDRSSPFYSPAACWPVAANGRVFIVAPDRRMTAINLATGREVWRTDRWAVRESIGLSEDGRRVYVRTTQDVIAAVSTAADTPEPVWETNAGFGYDINSAMLVEKDGVVFYGTKNGLLLALDAATGAVKWRHRVGVALLNTVTPLSASEVVVTDFDGRVSLVIADR